MAKKEPASTLSNPSLAYFMLHDTTLGEPIRRIFLDTEHTESVVVNGRPRKLNNGVMQAESINEAGDTEIYWLTRDQASFTYWVLVNTITNMNTDEIDFEDEAEVTS